MILLPVRSKYLRSFRLQMESSNALKLDCFKSSAHMYLNLKMLVVTNDLLLGPTLIYGNEMVLILLFSFPKNLETFSQYLPQHLERMIFVAINLYIDS